MVAPRSIGPRRSQGGVELPTGGKRFPPQARERLPLGRVSRSGATPEPTVKVRMKENGQTPTLAGAATLSCLP